MKFGPEIGFGFARVLFNLYRIGRQFDRVMNSQPPPVEIRIQRRETEREAIKRALRDSSAFVQIIFNSGDGYIQFATPDDKTAFSQRDVSGLPKAESIDPSAGSGKGLDHASASQSALVPVNSPKASSLEALFGDTVEITLLDRRNRQ